MLQWWRRLLDRLFPSREAQTEEAEEGRLRAVLSETESKSRDLVDRYRSISRGL